MGSGYGVYRDVGGKPEKREYIETVTTPDHAQRDCDYVRKRLPPEDKVFHQWEMQPQNVPTFDVRNLSEPRNAPDEGGAT